MLLGTVTPRKEMLALRCWTINPTLHIRKDEFSMVQISVCLVIIHIPEQPIPSLGICLLPKNLIPQSRHCLCTLFHHLSLLICKELSQTFHPESVPRPRRLHALVDIVMAEPGRTVAHRIVKPAYPTFAKIFSCGIACRGRFLRQVLS